MTTRFPRLAALLMTMTLAACGGGGGGGDGGGGTVSGSWLSFNPSAVELSSYLSETRDFSITATSSRRFTNPVNVAIVDSKGIITTDIQIMAHTDLIYEVRMHTASTLPAGTHQGNLEVRLCEDDARTCRKPLPGSPWFVPIKLVVKSHAEAATRLTLSGGPVNWTSFPDEAVTADISAAIGGDLVGQSYQVGIIDPANRVTGYLTASTAQGFTARLSTNASVPPGQYNNNIEVRLCRDDPLVCHQPVPGSPWLLPVNLTVKSPINLSTLAPVAGLGAWSGDHGNAAHTSFVPASFDASKFSRRWSIPAKNNSSHSLHMAPTDNGMVFLTRNNYDTHTSELYAISESTGTEVWRHDFGTISRVNAPAVGNGHVYVTSTGHQDSFFWVFDQHSGALLHKTIMSSQWESYLAPTVVGTEIYTENGYYGGMGKFSDTGSALWWSALPQVDGWSPAVDTRFAYTYLSGSLFALNLASGEAGWTVFDEGGTYGARPVVLAGNRAVVASLSRLAAFDLDLHKAAWNVNGVFTSQASFGNGTLYVLSPGTDTNATVLQARAPADGALLWSADPVIGGYSQLLVTRNLAFISGYNSTRAIDLNTRKVVWSHVKGGKLSISANGVLYIYGETGELSAVNLQ